MRVNRLLLRQLVIAISSSIVVTYLQKRIGGPVGGLIPGAIGFLIAWIITPPISNDITRFQCWLVRRHSKAGPPVPVPAENEALPTVQQGLQVGGMATYL
jgi:hypothetical protein